MKQTYDHTLAGWANALEYRDKETKEHSKRVTELTLRLAHALEVEEGQLEHVLRGALLHDIGKMAIPDSILQKPAGLSPEEWSIMRTHSMVGFELLKEIPFLRPALEIPLGHHEWWDGSGYPRGLSGEDIPKMARIFAIVDVWDALLSDRPYRSAWPKEKVKQYMLELRGRQFDPCILDTFFSIVD
jgi:putative nucleotidyltransferase with HDIG domain